MTSRNRDRRGMDRMTGDSTETGPDTGGWKPHWESDAKYLNATGGNDASPEPFSLSDLPVDLQPGADKPLYVRVNGRLAAVQDYSIMPRRGVIVLELDQ
jgi:hypothetical protein